MENHSEPNLQLESEYNLKPDDIINVELPAESKAGPSLPTKKKFLHVEVPTLKRNRPDDKEIDIPNPKHVCVLMAYIAELENKIKSVYHVDIRIPILKIYQETINNPIFAEEWKDAMDLKLKALISNSTWTETVLLKDANLVLSRWIFDIKYIPTGKIKHFKTHLVARRFSQIYGVDYGETFASTVHTDSIRLLLTLAAINDWEIHQINISNTFINSELKEQIFIKLLPGLKILSGSILLLRRSLYSLK